MPFVLAPVEDVKGPGDFPEYIGAMAATEAAAIARARELWNGQEPGGVLPTASQFGIGPLRKNDLSNDATDTAPSGTYTFRRNNTATAWVPVFNYTIRQDMINFFSGFSITDDVLRYTQFRMELGSNIFPIFDLQEVQRYKHFAFVIKTDVGNELVADPKTRVLVRFYVESTGFQRVVPIGGMLYRRKDLVIVET